MDSDVPYLPPDIIKNILKRLLAKSLIRFRSVRKDWKILLRNSSFIADHLQQQSCHQIPSLLFECNHQPWCCCLRLLDSELQVRKVHSIPRLKGVRIVGSCNGLLCVQIDPHELNYDEEDLLPYILLWNPATREHRGVPLRYDIYVRNWIYGFGFSSVVHDYRIVRFFVSDGARIRQGEVFSLSTGLWKEIEVDLEVVLHSCLESVSIDGVIFWHGLKKGLERNYLEIGYEDLDMNMDLNLMDEEEDDFVLSFDIATEVFTWMPWPALDHSRPKFAPYVNRLAVYDNKLALLSHTKVGDFLAQSSLIDLWVMEEKSAGSSVGRWSWTKMHTIVSSLDACLYPFCVWRNDIVCEVPTELEVVGRLVILLSLLNPEADEMKQVTIPRQHHRISAIFNYVKSLVSVGNICTEEPSSSS